MNGEPLAEGAAADVNVLVVDDVAQNLLAMHALLRRDGVRVLTAANGAQALELLLQHDVALALLDVQMPEMDGFALAELMRGAQRTRDVPIIFLTATPDDPRRTFRGYEAGAVDYLHKPIDPHVIRSKVAVFIELHQQRRLLKDRNEQLERVLKLNETMGAVLMHDLRAPLSAIMMSTEVLRARAQDDASRKTAERLKRAALRMSRMIEQLLDFSRIRGGVLRLQRAEADVAALGAGAVNELRAVYPNARVELTTEGDCRAAVDADRISQVFTNLVGNALQHVGDQGAVRITIDGRDPRMVRVAVVNPGELPPALLPTLFEAFKTARAHDSGGLGLGLYIVDQFVRLHGGSVEAANTPEGVCVGFTLPRAAP